MLHVDDEPDFAELAATFVQRHDERLNVETTTNPREALDRIRTDGVHCVVSDYDMPEQSGIEFLKAVREEYPDLPFILFTGKGSEEVASEAIQAGVTDYIQKESGTSQYEVLANRIRNAVDQHLAKEYAAETEHRLQTIAENTNDILWKFTADWDELLFINSPFEEIWGHSIDELRERPQSFLEGIHPDHRDLVVDAMGQLSSGESVDVEFRVNADEEFGRWIWVQGEPVFDDAGDVEKVVGFARDISDRKLREQALTEHRVDLRLYKRAVESSNDLLAAADTDYNLLFANERYREYHGLSPAEIEHTALPDYLGETWEVEVKPRLDRALAGESIRYEMDREGADGADRALDIRYYPLRADEDTIIGAVAAMRDLTDPVEQGESFDGQKDRRHRISEGIESDSESPPNQRDEYDQFVDFFENAAVPMHWVGPNGTVLHANQAELDALGYSRDEYVGRHIAEFHADQDVIDDILDRLSSDEELQDYEARMVRKDGSIRHVLIDSCVNWENGEFVNTRCVTRDVTERKERQRELQRKNARLDKFASIVSHDLRNPLSVVEGRLKLAQMDGDLEHIGPAMTAIQRSQTLIDDLLSLAKEGEKVADPQPTRLGDVLENCREFVETTAASLTIDTDQVVQADPSRLRQMTENLIRNAINHGGDDVSISVGTLENQDGFYVADDGPGIPEPERERVFESGHSTSNEGTGLGLAIVEEIVEAHGWDILVTDSSHGGARFEITGVETVAE